MTLIHIDKKLREIFNLKNFDTISNVENIERINFNQKVESETDLDKLYQEAFELISKLFGKNNIYVRLTYWDKKDFIESKYSYNILDIKYKADRIISLLEFDSLNDSLFNIIKKHLNFELVIDPSINITCFLFNFHIKILLNIYDDRGADFIVSKY